MGVRPASTLFNVSAGTSTTEATRNLAKARLQLGLDQPTRVLEWDPLEDGAEEALHDHPLGRGLGDAARAQVEEMLWIDWADRGSMRAAHFVVVDLEHGDRCRLRMIREHKVPVGLVCVRVGRALLDSDEPCVNSSCHVLQRAFEEKVGPRVA